MCATYGLGGGPSPEDQELNLDLPPLNERVNANQVSQWMDQHRHTAQITGKNKHNLNPLIRQEAGQRQLEFAWWWLHLGGKPAEFSAFNSRDDKLVSRWKKGFQQRALLPATWYLEKGATFALEDNTVFGIAAITTTVNYEDGTSLTTYSMVTRDAVAHARDVHPRMPLILPRQFHDTWLGTERPGDQVLVTETVMASEELSHQVRRVPDPVQEAGQSALF